MSGLKTIPSRPNIYRIHSSDTKDDTESIFQLIDELSAKALRESSFADWKATLFKWIHIIGSIFITVAGSVIGVLGVVTNSDTNLYNSTAIATKNYNGAQLTFIILGFCVTICKAMLSLFGIEKKSYLYKQSALDLKKISRSANELRSMDMTEQERAKRINELYADMDDLDIYMFSNGATKPAPVVEPNVRDTVVNI
jgi:hypothetical protein